MTNEIKVTRIKFAGRMVNPNTNRPVNVNTGITLSGAEVAFYTFRTKKMFIPAMEYHMQWKPNTTGLV